MSLERDPEAAGAPVTAYNWQDPPYNRWAFWHVDDILPTHQVSRGDGPARVLPAATAVPDLFGLPITRLDGSAGTASEILADTFTDAYVVLQDGELVTEWYDPLGVPDRPHALMSVSKSVVGCVAAVLIDRGQLDVGRLVTSCALLYSIKVGSFSDPVGLTSTHRFPNGSNAIPSAQLRYCGLPVLLGSWMTAP